MSSDASERKSELSMSAPWSIATESARISTESNSSSAIDSPVLASLMCTRSSRTIGLPTACHSTRFWRASSSLLPLSSNSALRLPGGTVLSSQSSLPGATDDSCASHTGMSGSEEGEKKARKVRRERANRERHVRRKLRKPQPCRQ
eukprot:831588-Rhodomonas_salina.2